ncbi:MAG: tetratricopeptide repeat protein [Nocardioidaceae bacterium]|nr:tetratricopeptide repeat protein [Nocardioidaceae bacterium]
MTQEPFSRPGAVDLSGLSATAPAGAAGVSGAYTVTVDEQSFQSLLESSMSAPVMLAFYSPSRSPESVQLADDLQVLSNEFEGRFLLGRVDIDATPQIAQAMQIPSVPLVVLVAQGRPVPLIQNAAPREELRAAITQVLQQLTAGGFTGRHQPRSAGVDEEGEELVDPRYAPAQDALANNDIEGAIAEYTKLLDGNPADAEAAAGLAMAQLLQRTQGADLNAAREAAAANPDDVDAQTLVADLDLLGGHVDDAFNRLINLVRRTAEEDRDRARTHLIALFGAVGNADPRVQRARRDLASALF